MDIKVGDKIIMKKVNTLCELLLAGGVIYCGRMLLGERSTELNFSFIKVNNRAVLRGRKSLDSGVDFLADS